MPQRRVDFYLLNKSDTEATLLVACRLLEKAYQRGHRVFVFCDTQKTAEDLDECLWTFKEDSFIPHHLQGEGPTPPPPIQIGYQTAPQGFNDVLLNLSVTIPPFFSQFRRVMEIVASDEAAKAISRDHYRVYRTQQCSLHTHQLD